jgi:hypothetical protein
MGYVDKRNYANRKTIKLMATSIEKNTKKLKFERLAKLVEERDSLFEHQENQKAELGLNDDGSSNIFCRGGRVKKPLGGTVDLGQLFGNAYESSFGPNINMVGNDLNYITPGNSSPYIKSTSEALDMSLNPQLAYPQSTPASSAPVGPGINRAGGDFNWWDAASYGAQLAGPLYNIGKGLSGAKKMDAQNYYNTLANPAMAELRDNTRYNAGPELQNIANIYSGARRNVASGGAQSTGSLFQRYAQLAANEAQAVSPVHSKKQNMEAQWKIDRKARLSNLMAQLGADKAATKLNVELMNQRAQAVQSQYLGRGLTDLGNFAQVQQQMANQKQRDSLVPDILKTTFQSVAPYMGNLFNNLG